jgi:uncharacterized protein (TIGR00730 family)
LRRICVFAGSNPGKRPEYQQAAHELGQTLVARGYGLVYGGASVGLMGTLADAMLAANGEVTGVIPQGLFRREVAHDNLSRLYTVKSMHERKALMADLSDGFIALPGGFGTFDELFEITTWAQLGIHTKPIGLLNIAEFFTPFLTLVSHTAEEGFIQPSHIQLLLHEDNPATLLDAFASFTPAELSAKWTELAPEK